MANYDAHVRAFVAVVQATQEGQANGPVAMPNIVQGTQALFGDLPRTYTFGMVQAVELVQTSGVGSPEAFGASKVEIGLPQALGIASYEAFGLAQASSTAVQVVGVASSEAFGPSSAGSSIAIDQTVGLPSAEAFATSGVGLGLAQAFGVASGVTFGASSVGAELAQADGVVTGEQFALSRAELAATQSDGVPSQEAFGASNVEVIVNSIGLGSDEAFGASSLAAAANQTLGVPSEEAFGASDAVYDRELFQFAPIESEETFGRSNVATAGDDVQARPLWIRRGGSSSKSDGPKWNVVVRAEMLGRDGATLNEVKGASVKEVRQANGITVRCRLIEQAVERVPESRITVRAAMFRPPAPEQPKPTVSGALVAKVA